MTLRAIAIISASLLLAACGQDRQQQTEDAGGKSGCPEANEAGIIEIAPGLTARITGNGYGRAAVPGDYADVHTTLWLYDEAAEGGRGTEIWSSGGDRPFQFQLNSGQVIAGWDHGVVCMLVGETRELIIPPEMGYGARGKPPVPPNATLLFEIELVKLTSPTD
ncbi:MAG: FKBP-type peptidyl-prolyl cis-trans isomerase [Gammaproteobacteria bacterium]|nr:FKBP-type peptidyl-prolyl cis-trans isomerase [Gammaproteobacteria bacterium]